ncbi:hypothetical protein O0Q50_08105 [Priestia aryabhattai]|uniref:Poly A polymerase head domain-containing protein n=1 Tax=Priestia aryabhattai TaxID=412384 RepID=A0AAX6N5V8_PRIAR|nr:hypothetical protein [Priestia aryabhattai]MDU9691126.1 hypothetical protein [Priestia aryabhattai]
MEYKPEIKNGFNKILSNRPNAQKMVKSLENQSELLLFGGSIRDYMDNKFNEVPRDFDIVLSNSTLNVLKNIQAIKCSVRSNKFGGYKVLVDDLVFDFWHLEDTWAFKKKIVPFNNISDLNKTVFLNIDAAFYNLNNECFYEKEFLDGLNNKILDIILTENPFPDLNLARAFILKYKYDMKLSKRLSLYFINWINDQKNDSEALNRLRSLEMKRYKTSIVNWSYEYESVKSLC